MDKDIEKIIFNKHKNADPKWIALTHTVMEGTLNDYMGFVVTLFKSEKEDDAYRMLMFPVFAMIMDSSPNIDVAISRINRLHKMLSDSIARVDKEYNSAGG